MAVAPDAESRAAERVLDIYREHRIAVIPAQAPSLTAALSERGFLPVGDAR